jgi:hypothetical protein
MSEHDMRDKPFLAAEIVGPNISMTLPDDPMVARLLLEHLRHAIEIREISKGMELQKKMREARNGNGVQLAPAAALKRLQGNN